MNPYLDWFSVRSDFKNYMGLETITGWVQEIDPLNRNRYDTFSY